MLDAALERSTVVRILASLPDRASAALEASGLPAVGDWVDRTVRASYCYRWLTAEPDPAVIVIDLRETYTVGPIVRVLESAGDRLADGYAHSRTERIASGVGATLRARPIRALGAVGLACVPVSLLTITLLGALSAVLFGGHLVTAALSAVALRSTHSLADVLESRPVSVLAAVFEPPEPPDSRHVPAQEGEKAENTASSTEQSEHAEDVDLSETERERTENNGSRE